MTVGDSSREQLRIRRIRWNNIKTAPVCACASLQLNELGGGAFTVYFDLYHQHQVPVWIHCIYHPLLILSFCNATRNAIANNHSLSWNGDVLNGGCNLQVYYMLFIWFSNPLRNYL